MSEPQAIEQARSAVEKILTALNVTRVVCVDDEYEEEPPVEEVLAAIASLSREVLKEILPELGETISTDQDVLNQQIRSLWKEIGSVVRRERTEKILATARMQDKAATDDSGDASILNELIPGGRLLTITPNQWNARREELLREDTGCGTLFLFDQNLSKSGGDPQGGIKIIASLLARNDTSNLICGLLTHTVIPENQPEKWSELGRMYNIPLDRFLVIPKQYLSRDPVFFAQLLKLVALSPDFLSLKKKTREIIADAAGFATNQVDKVSIYDLDHIVFRVSAEEGLWEPDMLFRLHALFHRLEARRSAHADGGLEAIAKRLRSVSQIPTDSTVRLASSTWKIQNQELYEPAEYLNENYLPLELGDIFIKTGSDSKKFYILLTQPCDLMVRGNGERQPEPTYVPIAEIVCPTQPKTDALRVMEEILYFGDDPKKRWFVKLKQVHQVKTCILDLCVLNKDGKALIQINGGNPPDAIRPAWKVRYKILAKLFGRLVSRLDLLSPAPSDSLETKRTKDELLKKILNEGLFKGNITEEGGHQYISYNCCRIGRLSRARAFGLLMSYTGCLCRPAFDKEFGHPPTPADGN